MQSNDAWKLHNENDPSHDNYSILEQLEDFRGEDGEFHFKLVYPEGSSYANSGGNISFEAQEWKQSSNPLTSTSVAGYESIDINYTGQYWGGLENADDQTQTLIDGSVNHSNWFYAIGTANAWEGGIPGPGNGGGVVYAVQVAELYVMSSCDDDDDDGLCDDDDDCVGSYDECGICGGSGIPADSCDCDGNILDCAGECGGSAEVNECGICSESDTECPSPQEWTLLFRQTAGFYQSKDAWRLHNDNDPTNANYSILEQLEDFRGEDEKLHFKLVWPQSSTYTGNQEWKQSSNPENATSSGVSGYEAIDINYTTESWGGLEYNTGGSSLLDGSVNHDHWYYAVGSTGAWGNGIPGPGSPGETRVELYVKSNVISGCDYNDDDVVDVLDIVGMIDCVLTEGCFDGSQCDWNADGNLDIIDVVSAINCIIIPTGCSQDCNAVWGGESVEDQCGECGGNGSSCGLILLSIPQPLHFYARDLTSDNCSFIIEGETIGVELEGDVSVTVTRDGFPFSETTTAFSQFSIDITIEPGMYLYEVTVAWDKGTNNWETVTTIEDIVCGDVFLIDGQSNAVASDYHNEELADSAINTFVRSFGSSVSNSSVADHQNFVFAVAETGYTHGSIGQWGLQLGNVMMETQDMPILLINGAVGGTLVAQHQRNDSNPEDINTIYGRLLWRAQQAKVAESVRAIFWHQGESDGNMAYDTYLELWTSMYDDWLEDYPNLEGIYPFQVRSGCGNPTWNRNVHRELPEILPLVAGSMSTTGVDGHDGCHFYHQTYVEWGDRMARVINRDLYNTEVSDNCEAPSPVSAMWVESNKLEINYGSTGGGLVLQPGSVAYFSLSDGTMITDATVIGNTVVLTTDNPSNASWISFIDVPGDIPWLINNLGIGGFAYYEFPITP